MKENGHTYHEGTLTTPHGSQSFVCGTGFDRLNISSGGRHGHFDVYHEKFEGGFLNGQILIPGDEHHYEGWPSFWRYSGAIPWPPVALDTPSKEWLSTQLLANTNPSKPKIDVGRAIGELKDLPGMLRDIGDEFLNKGFHKAAAGLHLSYEFGWAPFCQDVANLFLCQDAIKKRFDTLKKLRKQKSILRKIALWDQTNTSYGEGHCDYWKMSLSTAARDKVWGYTIWQTTDDFPATDAELQARALRCALNLRPNPKIMWDLLPWSWAIDWFANVGQFIQAKDNEAHAQCVLANLCFTQQRIKRARAQSREGGIPYEDIGSHMEITPIRQETVQKFRFRASPPTLTAQFPILTNDQLGILGSLAISKGRDPTLPGAFIRNPYLPR